MLSSSRTETVLLNGRIVQVHLDASAVRALNQRSAPLVVELELYFSCLVRKAVRFHDEVAGRPTASVNHKLRLFFRPVVSEACSIESAERAGGQPVTEIDSPVLQRLAPRQVFLKHAAGSWQGSYII